MGQADPILTKLGAGPAVKKLVETALALSSSQDPQQRNHAYSFMESAIKELESEDSLGADAGLGPSVDDGINAPKLKEEEDNDDKGKKLHEEKEDDDDVFKKLHEQDDDKDDHKLHEEVLDNHNNGPREGGSEQSTHNTAPYPGEGIDTTNGEKPMQDMDGTVNQWSETNGMIVPGIPPIENGGMGMNGGMGNGGMDMNGGGMNGAPQGGPGLMPDIAREMGAGMPAPPPMDTNQMMRQMQYTVQQEMRKYHNKVVIPLNRIIIQQREAILKQREAFLNQKEAIKKIAGDIREAVTSNGTMKLDLDTMRQNSTAKFRETEPTPFADAHKQSQTFVGVQPVPNYQRNKVAMARSEIENMDKMLNSQKNPMYN